MAGEITKRLGQIPPLKTLYVGVFDSTGSRHSYFAYQVIANDVWKVSKNDVTNYMFSNNLMPEDADTRTYDICLIENPEEG